MDLMARIAAAKAAAEAKKKQTEEARNEKEIEATPAPAPAPSGEESKSTSAAEPAAAEPAEPPAQPSAGTTSGLRLPSRPTALKPIGSTNARNTASVHRLHANDDADLYDNSSPLSTSIADPSPTSYTAPAPSMLTTLAARRDAAAGKPPAPEEAAALAHLGTGEVTDAAKSAISSGKNYSPEEFLHEWNQLDADENSTIDDRADLLRRACAEIQRLYEIEIEGLRTGSANDLSIVELSQLIKLTFLRVKDSPAAWAMLDRTDKAAVIKSIIAMATKRNSAVKSRKPKDAAAMSASLDAAVDPAVDAVADAFAGVDFGDF